MDSDLKSEGIYFNNDASSVSTDFSDDVEAENRYFDDISESEQQIPAKYKTEKNQRKTIPCYGQITMPFKGKKAGATKQKLNYLKSY